MEFEEMKRIWDMQRDEPLYAIDERTLHDRVIRKNAGIRRMASVSEWSLLFMAFGMALAMIVEGVLQNELYQLPQGVIFLLVAAYIYYDRKQRLKYDGRSDRTLLGDLEQAIRTIDYHIRRQRRFVWWFLLPAVVAVLVSAPFTWSGKPWWLWLLALGAFGVSWWVVRLELRRTIAPRREDLEALRRMLLEAD